MVVSFLTVSFNEIFTLVLTNEFRPKKQPFMFVLCQTVTDLLKVRNTVRLSNMIVIED